MQNKKMGQPKLPQVQQGGVMKKHYPYLSINYAPGEPKTQRGSENPKE